MIVDAHTHILPDSVRTNLDGVAADDAWFAICHQSEKRRVASAETLLMAMDEQGVDVAVCFTWPFRAPERCREANDYVAAAVRRFPGRLIGFGVVAPDDPHAAAEIHRCASLGLRGIGELNADAQGFALTDFATLEPLVAASREEGLVWNLHCSEPVGHRYPGKGLATPDRVAAFAEEFPDLPVICSHLGGGLPLYAHMPEVRDLCARLYFDTAAVPWLYAPSALRAIADLIGAGRLLLGTDHPLLEVSRYRSLLAAAPLTDAETDAVMGGSAAALFGL